MTAELAHVERGLPGRRSAFATIVAVKSGASSCRSPSRSLRRARNEGKAGGEREDDERHARDVRAVASASSARHLG